MNIIRFDTIGSTNVEAKSDAYHHGDALVAMEQTDGRGQRGHRWASRAGENLTFSVVWEPEQLSAANQFLLSEATALAIADTLNSYGIKSLIKWTNDIYVGDRKICGILIENFVSGGNVARSIIGIGLNVNQTEFDEWVPNPTSMKLLCGDCDTDEVLGRLCEALEFRYGQTGSDAIELSAEYNHRLYRLGEEHTYTLPDGSSFAGRIRGVEPDGYLIVEHDGREERFAFKEIEFVI